MGTEADTCRTLVTPKLQAAGWENHLHSIAEQVTFTDGRIVVHGKKATRRKGKRADYLLRYTRDFPIAVVEAKPEDGLAVTGMQKSKEYAEIPGLKFAFFNYFAPEAREILNDLLEKYATDGELQFTLPDVLKVPPISQHGNVAEIIGTFGGADQLRNAVNLLQSLLYAT